MCANIETWPTVLVDIHLYTYGIPHNTIISTLLDSSTTTTVDVYSIHLSRLFVFIFYNDIESIDRYRNWIREIPSWPLIYPIRCFIISSHFFLVPSGLSLSLSLSKSSPWRGVSTLALQSISISLPSSLRITKACWMMVRTFNRLLSTPDKGGRTMFHWSRSLRPPRPVVVKTVGEISNDSVAVPLGRQTIGASPWLFVDNSSLLDWLPVDSSAKRSRIRNETDSFDWYPCPPFIPHTSRFVFCIMVTARWRFCFRARL